MDVESAGKLTSDCALTWIVITGKTSNQKRMQLTRLFMI